MVEYLLGKADWRLKDICELSVCDYVVIHGHERVWRCVMAYYERIDGCPVLNDIVEKVESGCLDGYKEQLLSGVSWKEIDCTYAAELGMIDFIRRFHSKVNTINERETYGRYLIHHASITGKIDIVCWLIDSGAEVNCECVDGYTPLAFATMGNHIETIRVLLEKSTQENIQSTIRFAKTEETIELLSEKVTNIEAPKAESPGRNKDGKLIRVGIIGAGISGLSAALELVKNTDLNLEITIIEARDRIGGRVWSSTILSDDVTIDLGAQWIHECGERNPILRATHALNVPLEKWVVEEEETYNVFDFDGTPIPTELCDEVHDFLQLAESMEGEPDRHIEITNDTSFEDVFCCYDYYNQNYKAGSTLKDRLLGYYISNLESWEGGSPHELGYQMNDEFYEKFSGNEIFIRGGYGALLNRLYEEISPKANFLFSSVVQSIKHYDDEVTVLLDSQETFSFDYCICSTPLGVLKNSFIEFDPPLPQEKQLAISSLGFGVINKIAALFKTDFWKDIKTSRDFAFASQDYKRSKFITDTTDYVNQPVLIAFYTGDGAARLEKLTDEECMKEFMEDIRVMFGDVTEEPISYYITRWGGDNFSKGSYSFIKAGCYEDVFKDMSKPINNLRFAGEHTNSSNYSCVTGAWISGVREASRIIREKHFPGRNFCQFTKRGGQLCTNEAQCPDGQCTKHFNSYRF